MKKKIMGLWITCICAVAMLLTGTVSHAEVIHETDLEKYILEEMSAAHVLGMSISIVSPSKELYCAAYGQAQNTDMDYVLGGTTKSLTATAILHMAEVKDLSLDDTVADYLPDYPAVGDVTIRELLYQTSGIAPEERMSDLQGLGTRGEFADANANYNLLGMIIERISDISYEEYISDTILDTLEMESTYSKRNDTGMEGTLLPAYQGYFGFPFATQYQYDKAEDWMQVPAGQMISDVKDMGNYLQLLLNNGGELLLGKNVKQLLYGDVVVADTDGKMFGGSASGGMGWFSKEVDGQTVLYSTGITENYNTALVLLPEKDLGIAMMFNSTDFLVGQQLINTLQEGIVSIELEREPERVDRDIYITQHGIYDVIMVLLVLAAWMPILLMGVWCRHRRKKLFSIPSIVMDILIQLVLPTALLLVLPKTFPIFLIKRMTPDIYYVGLTIILTLYLGAVIKLIAMVILRLLPQRATEETTVTEETAAAEIASEVAGTVKAASTRAKRDRMLETVRTGVLEQDDMVTEKAGKVGKPVEISEKADKTLSKSPKQQERMKRNLERREKTADDLKQQDKTAESPKRKEKATENQKQQENATENRKQQDKTVESEEQKVNAAESLTQAAKTTESREQKVNAAESLTQTANTTEDREQKENTTANTTEGREQKVNTTANTKQTAKAAENLEQSVEKGQESKADEDPSSKKTSVQKRETVLTPKSSTQTNKATNSKGKPNQRKGKKSTHKRKK